MKTRGAVLAVMEGSPNFMRFLNKLFLTTSLALTIFTGSVLANTIVDTSGLWATNGGAINEGWLGSGQSITVPFAATYFNSFTVYADAAASGRTFTFRIYDALNGGNILYNGGGVLISTGANTININQTFAAGSVIFAEFDYNGYSGRSLQYLNNVYVGGNSSFGPVGSQSGFSSLDHRFTADFSGNVPDGGATIGLLGLAMSGMAWMRRKLA